MIEKNRWVCPDCGEGFGSDFLRCACGYEGSPVPSRSKAVFRKKENNSHQIAAETLSGQNLYADVEYNNFLAEEFMKKAEKEYRKSRAERDTVEGLKTRLKAGLNKINKINNNDPFDVLGVHKTDSIETIHRTYRAIVALYHPDKHSSATEESRQQKSNYLSEINGAYESILKMHKSKDVEYKH